MPDGRRGRSVHGQPLQDAFPIPLINAPEGGYRVGTYLEAPVPPNVRCLVEAVWRVAAMAPETDDGAAAVHRVLPETGVSLCLVQRRGRAGAIAESTLVLMGPIREARMFRPEAELRMEGVRLKVEWCRDALGVEPGDVADWFGPASEVMGPAGRRLHDRLAGIRRPGQATRVLLAELEHRRAVASVDADTRLARRVLDGVRRAPGAAKPVRSSAAALGVSERHLRRVMHRTCGQGLKQFQRVRRLQTALAMGSGGEPPAWGRVALAAGYADQAHMVREFGTLAGATPPVVRRERRALTEAASA